MYNNVDDAAEALYAAIPHAITAGMVEEYGIAAGPEQVQDLTEEILALNLFWSQCALESVLYPIQRDQVMGALRRRIRRGWETDLSLAGRDAERFVAESGERVRAYRQCVREGVSPLDAARVAASDITGNSIVREEDRGKLVALLMDLIMIEDLGLVAEQIKL